MVLMHALHWALSILKNKFQLEMKIFLDRAYVKFYNSRPVNTTKLSAFSNNIYESTSLFRCR